MTEATDPVASLFARLNPSDPGSRWKAIEELSGLDDLALVSQLTAMLADHRAVQRAAAAEILGAMAARHRQLPNADPGTRAVADAVSATFDRLLHMYREDPDGRNRAIALDACGNFFAVDPARWLPTVVAASDDRDPWVRYHAAFQLRRLDPSGEHAVKALAGVLTDPELPGSNCWQEAAICLGDFGARAQPALPALRHRLYADGTDEDLQQSIIDTMVKTRGGAVVAELAAVATDERFAASLREYARWKATPEELLFGVLWSFSCHYPDPHTFAAALQNDANPSTDDLRMMAVAGPGLRVWYEDFSVNGPVEEITIVADLPGGISGLHLLWKLNEALVDRLAGHDRCFFEGLRLAKLPPPGQPAAYWPRLGS